MRPETFLSEVRSRPGVLRAEPLSPEMITEIVNEEDSVKVFSGSMDMEPVGLGKCICKDFAAAIFCDSRFPRPDRITIEIVDEDGKLLGHDVPDGLAGYIRKRKGDAIWLSENFVMYPDAITPLRPRMVMNASPFPGKKGFGGLDPWVFYPSVTTADLINRLFGVKESTGVSTIVLGVDGVRASMPVPDVVEVPCGRGGHGEPSPEDAFYRRHLVGEGLERLQLPLADEDLHALVAVQMDVDGRVDGGHVAVLDVGQLVPDGIEGVVVDQDHGSDHPLLVVLPLVLGQGVADEVADGLRPAHIALAPDGIVELLEELRLQRYANARDPFHDGSNRTKSNNTFQSMFAAQAPTRMHCISFYPSLRIHATMSMNSENLENAIVSAVRTGVEDRDVAVAFSGGLDSGLVAAIAKDYARSVTLYTSGKDESYDVVMARDMSERLGLPWLHIPITKDNIESRLREMISITGTSSPLTLSFELPLFFVCRTVHERYIIGGQGSDELFAGYTKYVNMPDDELVRAMKSDMGKLITSTIPHETKVANHFGKTILYPYIDPIVTMQVGAMDIADLKPADADSRKMLLKQVARNLGYPFIAEKRKKAAQYGSGTMDLVREIAADKGMTYHELVDSIYRELFD